MEQYATTIRKLEEQRTSLNANLTHERAKNQRLAEALKELLDYTLALELVAYDAAERRYEHPEVTAARAALREAGVES